MPTSPNAATSVRPAKELNEKNIKKAEPGDVLRDATVKGLHLRAFPESKGFYLYYRTKAGKERKPKLGDFGAITLAQARKVAQEMLTEVAAGRDPGQHRIDTRNEQTVADLWDEFWARKASHNKSAAGQKWYWESKVKPKFGSKRLSEVNYSMVADRIQSMAETPINANRTLALLSAMFNFAIRPLEWTEKNPCKGVTRYKEVKRRRYMAGEEAAKIAEILDREADENPASVAFLYLLILTGARKGEIAGAKWSWLNGNVLALPDSKTGAKSVYLPPQALDVLAKLPRTTGTITGILSPQKLWLRVRKEAGCEDLRMHDLRHSFASAALSAGLSLSQIGELLGHKSTQTTKRYAHLVEEAATAAATATADRIMLGMKKAPTKVRAEGPTKETTG
jgi:integrase